PDRDRELAARDCRQDLWPLGPGAESQERRAGLPIGDPVRGHRRAGSQHLFENHVALEGAPLVAAVALGPRHADPTARAHLLAELAVEATPGVRAQHWRPVPQLTAEGPPPPGA